MSSKSVSPMKLKPKFSIAEHFETVEDPRIERSKEHLLIDILTIAILAVICGADGWVGIETYGKAKYQWLKRFLALPNGIPSHDTFARVFARLNPEQLQESFLSWVRAVSRVSEGEVIAIDGKTVRRSYDEGKNKGAIHMISAWASQNRLVLGQRKVDDKSNEITAIPELLKVLDLNGCIVTIDAMGTHKAIAISISPSPIPDRDRQNENCCSLSNSVEFLTKALVEGKSYSTEPVVDNSHYSQGDRQPQAIPNHENPHSKPKTRRISPENRERDTPEVMSEDINRAIDAILEFNNAPDRPHRQKFRISIKPVADLTGRATNSVSKILKERSEEIEHHHQQHQISSYHNKSRRDEKGHDYPPIQSEPQINYHKLTEIL